MKISCPFLHYPRYALKVYMKGGSIMNIRGPGAAEIDVPVAEEDVVTMVCASRDEAGNTGHCRMWVGGEWICFTDGDLESLLNPPVPSEFEPEPEPKECGDGCEGCDECLAEPETDKERVAPPERLWPEDGDVGE